MGFAEHIPRLHPIMATQAWDDDDKEGTPARPLTKEEASALREKDPPLSPWRVITAQVLVGIAAALLAGLLTQKQEVAWSVLYGAATVVVPGALMARGMTSRLSSMSPGWPALLAGLVLGMKVYWVALLWRGRTKQR
jgi:ATP synthase protein I